MAVLPPLTCGLRTLFPRTQATTGDPREIIRTIDAGLDAFLSVPPERFFAAARALKEATAAAAASADCRLVCVPPLETVESNVGSTAHLADQSELQATDCLAADGRGPGLPWA